MPVALLMGRFFSRFVDDDGDGKVTAVSNHMALDVGHVQASLREFDDFVKDDTDAAAVLSAVQRASDCMEAFLEQVFESAKTAA